MNFSRINEQLLVPRLLSYKELDILHALRGFCAFYVVVFHAKFILWSGGTEYLRMFPRASWSLWQYLAFLFDMLSSAGYEMVIFFFVLSGFFIRYAQLKKHRDMGAFYLNRIYRIYPPYLASLALSGGVIAFVALAYPALLAVHSGRELNASLLSAWHEMNPLSVKAIWHSLLFLRPGEQFFGFNNVYWSLLPEALFYLAVPLAFWRIRYYYTLSAGFYVLGLVMMGLHYDVSPVGQFALQYNGYFAVGMGLYDLVTTRAGWLAYFRRSSGLGLLLVTCLLFAGLIGTAILHLKVISGPLAAVLAVMSISALLAGRVSRQNPLVRAFHEVGIFSFSLYLYHFPLLVLSYAGLVSFTGELINYTRYYWLALPLVTAGCYALYYITERPAVQFFRGS